MKIMIMIIITLVYSFVLFRNNSEKEKAIIELKENKDKLQLILNSTAEAIYGMDILQEIFEAEKIIINSIRLLAIEY